MMASGGGDVDAPVRASDLDNEQQQSDNVLDIQDEQREGNDQLDRAESGGDEDAEHLDDDHDCEPPPKCRQWLIDRMLGKSPPPESIPPCWMCYIPPCISVAPDFFEQNCFCEQLGKVGVIHPNESPWRKRLMQLSAFANFVAFALSITACFAISTKFNILQKIPFSSGEMTLRNITSGARLRDLVRADVGLQAIAYSDPLFEDTVIRFDEFCDYNGTGLERFILPADCNACEDVSLSLILTVAMSAFPYLPAMLTSVIRMYYNYDINCMKTFGVLVNAVSMALAMYSYLGYKYICFNTFFEGDVYYSANLTEVDQDSDEAEVLGTVNWYAGNGFICIVCASALMGVDVICHLLVPSPTISRNHEEQAEYERLHTSSGVADKVSLKDFIGSFCDMILRRN